MLYFIAYAYVMCLLDFCSYELDRIPVSRLFFLFFVIFPYSHLTVIYFCFHFFIVSFFYLMNCHLTSSFVSHNTFCNKGKEHQSTLKRLFLYSSCRTQIKDLSGNTAKWKWETDMKPINRKTKNNLCIDEKIVSNTREYIWIFRFPFLWAEPCFLYLIDIEVITLEFISSELKSPFNKRK